MQSSRPSHETLDTLWLEQRALRQAIPEVYQSFENPSAEAAVQAGVTAPEAAEAIGVAIMMHGEPATVSGAQAYAAFCEFEDAVIRP